VVAAMLRSPLIGTQCVPARFLVRAKVFQLLGVFAGAAVLASVFSTVCAKLNITVDRCNMPCKPLTCISLACLSPQTNLPANDVAALAAVLVGCVVTSYCIWYVRWGTVGMAGSAT
jgi:glycerol uptake facilitator-like aquaporin